MKAQTHECWNCHCAENPGYQASLAGSVLDPDPQRCWDVICRDLHDLNRRWADYRLDCAAGRDLRRDTAEKLRALATWIEKGGFPPSPVLESKRYG